MMLAVAGALGVALVNPNLTTCLAAASISAILFASLFLSFFSLRSIDIKRGPAKDACIGDKVTLPVTIINKSKRRRQAFVIREKCPFTEKKYLNVPVGPLGGKETRLINRQTLAARRGYYNLKRITLVGGDPAGLFARRKSFDLKGEIMIYPDSVKLSYMPIRIKRQIQSSILGRPIGISGLGQEFFGVREYRPSDGVRFIHWKSCAKHGRLMVREFEANAATKVSILLDVESKFVGDDEFKSNFEYLVKTASSMVNYLAGMYCQILFATGYGKNDIWTSFGEVFSEKDRIMNTLAMIQPKALSFSELLDAEMDHIRANSILYCLSMSEPEGLTARFDALIERGVDVRWIYAPKKYFPIFLVPHPEPSSEEQNKYSERFGIAPYIARRDLSISRMLMYG
jgi:uncharacterized protein (DUF58 family)